MNCAIKLLKIIVLPTIYDGILGVSISFLLGHNDEEEELRNMLWEKSVIEEIIEEIVEEVVVEVDERNLRNSKIESVMKHRKKILQCFSSVSSGINC